MTAGHILQPTTPVLALFIEGKPVTPESRHTQLYAKYQRRLLEVKAGVAPLGLERLAPAPARIPTRAPPARPDSTRPESLVLSSGLGTTARRYRVKGPSSAIDSISQRKCL